MAAVPTTNNGSLAGTDIAQLLWQINNLKKSYDETQTSGDAARDLNGNLIARTNATNSAADQYNQLVQALMSQINQDPAAVMGDITNRSDSIFSSMAGTVDRANAISASQAGAGLLKRGMGDSTQATDAVTDNARKYQDVYQKLREAAYAQAMKEQQTKLASANQAFGTATQGAVNMTNVAQQSAANLASGAAAANGAANVNMGKNFTDLLGANLTQAFSKKAGDYITDSVNNPNANNGFSGIAGALKKAFGGSADAPGAGDFSLNAGATQPDNPWGSSSIKLPSAGATEDDGGMFSLNQPGTQQPQWSASAPAAQEDQQTSYVDWNDGWGEG